MKKIATAIIATIAYNGTAHAITVHRVTSLADHGPGTLRAAIAAAADGDRVTFAPWLYEKTIRLDGEIIIDKRLRIEGDINGDRRPDITLDGQHTTRLLKIAPAGNVTLWGMALGQGSATEGGAIYNDGNITAQYCEIKNNQASDSGGAIYNRGQTTISNSTVANNTAQRGGAIFNNKTLISENVKTTLEASTFTMNRAYAQGGAIYNYHGKFRAYSSTFGDNLAHDYHDWSYATDAKGSVLYQFGGGSLGGSAEFWDSTLRNNRSAPLRDKELRECDFGERKSDCSNRPDAERIRNNKNRRVNNGGTIYNRGVATNRSNIKLTRTVISDSIGRNCGGWGWFDLDHAWSDDNTCDGDVNYDGPGVSRGNAKLDALADNGGYTLTYSPLADSGLIDAAGSTCTVRDQRGAPRTRYPDTHCDIGAVDAKASAPSRLRPQTINTTPPAEHNEDLAVLHKTITTQKADISTKTETITAQQADISAKTETITAQQADISAKTETITAQQADISAKTKTITTLETQLQTLNSQLAAVQEHMTKKEGDMTQLEEQAEELEHKIAEHRARIAELEAPDELEATIGDAGEIKRLVLNGQDALHESETTIKIGTTTQRLKNTITEHIHDRTDGRKISAGELRGQNGLIRWEIMSSTIPGTNWQVSTWIFSSKQAFGDVALGIYTDIDIQPYTGFNGLIAGGQNHPNRLLITDRRNPSEGIALGVRALKNAQLLGWVGSPDIYHGRNGEVLDESILTGAYSGWGSFTPDSSKYPGARGYGPADIAVAMGIELKPSAKLASFEITLVGAPNGEIE
ncbi:choice-of-anchor Q domain-containing protein [Thiolapillus sp.]|uniref:choice-of-anchor Q domain-containing protein n=1 Tax=Thiolapillus sp. TaxID=2017437 RepID=UPI003AF78E1C